MLADDTTRDAIIAAAESFMAAYGAGDVDGAMAGLVPDDDLVLIGTEADEKRVGPAAARTQMERDQAQADDIALRMQDPLVSARGDVAWLTADVTFEGSVGGEAFALPGRLTAVFEHRDGRWLMANSHYSAPSASSEPGQSFPAA